MPIGTPTIILGIETTSAPDNFQYLKYPQITETGHKLYSYL